MVRKMRKGTCRGHISRFQSRLLLVHLWSGRYSSHRKISGKQVPRIHHVPQVWGSPALPEAKSHDQNILPTYVITYSLSFFTALIMADFRRDSAEYTPFSKGGDSLSARPSFQALANAKAAFQLLCYCSVACMFLHSFRFLFCLAAFTALPRSGGVLM